MLKAAEVSSFGDHCRRSEESQRHAWPEMLRLQEPSSMRHDFTSAASNLSIRSAAARIAFSISEMQDAAQQAEVLSIQPAQMSPSPGRASIVDTAMPKQE